MKNIRLTIVLLLLLIATLLSLAGRCFYLQYFRKQHYYSSSLKQRQKWVSQNPQRGVILDCRVRVLAASNKFQTIFADPQIINDPKQIAKKLQPILDINASQISNLISKSKNPGFVRLMPDADRAQCDAVRNIYGIGVISEWKRYYPIGNLASTVVGFTGRDNRGLEGIELQFDKQLKGSAGKNIFFTDKLRRSIRLKQQGESVTDGFGIILTIDSTIQQFAREELQKQYKNFEAEAAIAIVAEPKTGAILAMVSLPDFEPTATGSADPNTFRNRAITDTFEPGSIMKPIAVAIALDAGVIDKDEIIFCDNGDYRGKGFGKIGEYGPHRFADLPIREILVKSSNIGTAKIGQKLGKEKLYKGLKLFGFGKKTGIELPGEDTGLLWPISKWTGYSVTRIPFGQEVSVTAIQIVRAFCILANGGHYVRPYIVKAMVDNNGELIKLTKPPPSVGFIIKPEVAKWVVNDPLVGVVNEKSNGGTGWRAKLDKWQVFGKTGTAEIAKKDSKGYSEDDYVASFVAGAPAEDPKIVVLVSIRKPNKRLGKGYTGGAVASGVAGKIIEKTLYYLEEK